MLVRRIIQFFIVYIISLASLLGLKYSLDLSNYVVPDFPLLWETAQEVMGSYIPAVFNTLLVAFLVS